MIIHFLTPDIINAVLEAVSACIAWGNFARIKRDQTVRGVNPLNWIWYITWNFWDIFYIYPTLHQPITIIFAVCKMCAHISWFVLAMRLNRRRFLFRRDRLFV